MLTNNILNIVNEFNQKKTYIGKTIIQKVIYLTFSEEHRRKFYIPYLYGPYSEMVQLMVDSLIYSNYIIYSSDKKSLTLSKSLENKNFSFSEPYKKRFEYVLNFLFTNNVTSTEKISYLAKINMLVHNNNGTSRDPTFLKERASLLGWKDLASLKENDIKNLLDLSDSFDKKS
ncbi:hypothetical protein ACSSWA_13680 [Melioribacter sp. Ez-97]|uniref:hypothetical protein n=1 Tax=Melioribacter sp. Ez-97 TaxID=3423434 RepID=UPI003EDAC2DD